MLLTPQLFSKMTCPKFTIELDGLQILYGNNAKAS